MPSISVHLSESGDVGKLLRRFGREGQRLDQAVKEGLKIASRHVLQRARQLVPVDTGKLRAGLEDIAIPVRPGRFVFGRIVRTPTREKLGIPKDYPWYYPAAVEYGYTRRTKSGKVVKVLARPFIKPAQESSRGMVQTIFAHVVKGALSRA